MSSRVTKNSVTYFIHKKKNKNEFVNSDKSEMIFKKLHT